MDWRRATEHLREPIPRGGETVEEEDLRLSYMRVNSLNYSNTKFMDIRHDPAMPCATAHQYLRSADSNV